VTWVQLTQCTGAAVYVRTNAVAYLAPWGTEATRIIFVNGQDLMVQGNPETIANALGRIVT
jgi:hypothetical protein